MTMVESTMTLALLAVAITYVLRSRRPGRTAVGRRRTRGIFVTMFAFWFGALLLTRLLLWISS
ncbi:hypothetical protein OIE66_22615 [Nonomuraea sp. NBC_01738]|uniref:hypothetical protein n=1 Tax=Nonomuraea sp. NBC_01738 TaxID=2976003 RepID=UPI002E13B103|nr:hypothetical protein OIE66_22615 [Nonomuraea sp. NBC_01738]